MLFEEIQHANIAAMKERNKVHKDILSIVLGKCKNKIVEKRANNEELTDQDVLALIEKTVKELDEEILAFSKAGKEYEEKISNLNEQKNVLTKFLPTKLTKEEIELEISKLTDKSIPSVMKHFKENFAGKCDMKLVNEIARKLQ